MSSTFSTTNSWCVTPFGCDAKVPIVLFNVDRQQDSRLPHFYKQRKSSCWEDRTLMMDFALTKACYIYLHSNVNLISFVIIARR